MVDEDDVQEIVIYDSCVLYPYTLRDTLISLTKIGKFQARWTNKITEEWTSNLLKDVPGIKAERIGRTCDLMIQAVPDAIIEDTNTSLTTYRSRIPTTDMFWLRLSLWMQARSSPRTPGISRLIFCRHGKSKRVARMLSCLVC